MTTTKTELSDWFDRGVAQKQRYMIVVCDTFDWEDYPVFVTPTADRPISAEVAAYNGPNMQKVMEVYDLQAPKAAQLSQHRVRADLNLPV